MLFRSLRKYLSDVINIQAIEIALLICYEIRVNNFQERITPMLHSIKMLLLICVLSVSAHAITVRNLVNQDGTITKPVIEILGQAGVRIKGAEANPEWPPMKAELDSVDCQKVSDR